MKCNFFIAAQHVLIDIQSKRATAINILEDFQSPVFPIQIAASVLFVIHKENADLTENEVMLDVALDEIFIFKDYKIKISFNSLSKSVKSMTTFGGLVLPNSGLLLFSLKDSNNTILGEYAINVALTENIDITTNTA